MEKISFISPLQPQPAYQMATRIVVENLSRSPMFEPETIRVLSKEKNRYKIDKIYKKQIEFTSFYANVMSGEYDRDLDVDSEIALVSCTSIFDLYSVKKYLNENRVVVAGGPIIGLLGPEMIRNVLSKSDAKIEKLILVSKYVDLDTDIYKIIKDNKDITIDKNNFRTFFECDKNFYNEYHSGSRVFFGFDLYCKHGQCKFCTFAYAPKACFVNNVSPQEIVDNIHKTMTNHKSTTLQLVDSYFIYTKKNIEVLKLLEKYIVATYSGILSLQDVNYINLVSKYVKEIRIGLETVSDFGLENTNKGYTYEHINTAVNNIIKHMSRDVKLLFNIITDMPAKNVRDVVINYDRILKIKRTLTSEGFKVKFFFAPLSLFTNQKLIDGVLFDIKVYPPEMLSGFSYLVHLFRQSGIDGLSMVKGNFKDRRDIGIMDLYTPVVRYDENRRVLKTDMLLVDKEVMEEIFLEGE